MRGVWVTSLLLIGYCGRLSLCGEHPDGTSSVSREQDAVGNYRFSYSVVNNEGEQFRSEGTDTQGRVVGSYGLTNHDGTHRVVDYVADKDGFRAEVRSNEPGLTSAEAASASIVKTSDQLHAPLNVAATSDSRQEFGKRLHTEASKEAYVRPDDSETIDQAPIEQRNFDDYRPLSPVAYYPNDVRGPSSRLNPSTVRHPVDVSRSPRVLHQTPDDDSKPSNVYYPPIDPHTALRRPAYFAPRGRDTDQLLTTSRRPYIPPYGGFDDDPLPEDRKPDLSMTTIHGGLGSRRTLPSASPTPAYGARRFPPRGLPDHSDIDVPRFPISSGFPHSPRSPGSGSFPSYPQTMSPPGVLFNPPSYERGGGSPNFVLRAVPIPNGIQAVKMDPNTGRILERLVYPLFLRQDGVPEYDRNILLHNDDVPDDDASRFDDSGYFDTQFSGRPYRGVRDQPTEGRREALRRYNSSYSFDKEGLNEPTARDMAWVDRQLSMVEGFDRRPVSNRLLPYHDRSIRDGDVFDSDHPRYGGDSPNSRIRSLSSPDEFEEPSRLGSFSRNPRHSESSVGKELPSLDQQESSLNADADVESSSSKENNANA